LQTSLNMLMNLQLSKKKIAEFPLINEICNLILMLTFCYAVVFQ